MKLIPQLLSAILALSANSYVSSQTTLTRDAAMEAVRSHLPTLDLLPTDWAELQVTDFYTGRKSRLTYLYLQQARTGVPIDGATATVAFDPDGQMQLFTSRLVHSVDKRLGPGLPAFDASAALFKAAGLLDIQVAEGQVRILEEMQDERMTTRFVPDGVALEPIVAALSWVPVNGERIRLAWQVMWYTSDASHRWVLHIDATTGAELSRHDQVLSCDFGSPAHAHSHECLGYDLRGYRQSRQIAAATQSTAAPRHPNPVGLTQTAGETYRVFPVPVESPNHGGSDLVVNPADPVGSPFGWHDVDGQTGAEYTITRGNNVHAYHDAGNINDSSGDEPDGGASLIFDFPYDPTELPGVYRDAAVTNLFYWCNVVHDVWYNYGFDEEAGNFQLNNFGLGGDEGDYIRAEAQDGSGVNNANFSSGVDGSSARMQMYLWTNQANPLYLEVLGPDTVAGFYQTSLASFFGSPIPDTPIVGTLVQAIDGSASPTKACGAIVNAAEVGGNIALIDRGNCAFTDKVSNAQEAGASAVIVCNNESGGTVLQMGGSDGSITIPSVMISLEDCMTLKQFLSQGLTVKLEDNFITSFDGDFDNGIIAHEYGHGLSNRMTGGPSQAACLVNDEQMGEGWSDFTGLILTMEAGDMGSDVRGVGTFAINQSTTGNGIRPAPYSTDFGVNPYTYGNSNDANISLPHGVGFIWATALWDLTWDLIDVYGFDENFMTGQGGNNIAIQLVTEGMKLQPCNPGMIDGRDAILAADQLLYNGVNQCLIWEAFARRGFGFSASQGSSFDRFDQVEAFDLPLTCQTPVTAPSAALSVNLFENCAGEFSFSDLSTDVPQQWLWDFGDGTTSELQNPTHVYASEGTYTVVLMVSNPLGSSSDSLVVVVDQPDAPVAVNLSLCEGDTGMLVATATGQVNWYLDGQLVKSGDTLLTGTLPVGEYTYSMQTEVAKPTQSVGPADNTFGSGGYHNTGSTGTIDFTSHVPLVIESVWVDAASAGDRLIQLLNASGNAVDEVAVFIEQGQNRVTLNIEVPTPGNYSLAGTSVNLYRNSDGASFPYNLDSILTMTGTSAGVGYYYYFYDWKVREQSCFSPLSNVSVTTFARPAVSAGPELPCAAASLAFDEAGGEGTSWNWSGPGAFSSADQSPIVEPALEGIYTVTVTNASGCTSTDSLQVKPLPAVNAINGGPYCSGAIGRLYETQGEGVEWLWQFPSGFTSWIKSPAISPVVSGEYIVVVTSSNGCTNTDTTTICASAPTAVCLEEVELHLNPSSGEVLLTPDLLDGGSTAGVCLGLSELSVSSALLTCAETGANQVVLTVTDSLGCSSSCESTVLVMEPEQAPEGGICPCETDTLYLDGVLSATAFRASAYIESRAEIGSGTAVSMRAGQQINLLPGFVALPGSEFTALIAVCPDEFEPSDVTELPPASVSWLSGKLSDSQVKNAPNSRVWPNPFADQTLLEVDLPEATTLTVCIQHIRGGQIHTLLSAESVAAGFYRQTIDLRHLPAGMYLLTVRTATIQQTHQIAKVK